MTTWVSAPFPDMGGRDDAAAPMASHQRVGRGQVRQDQVGHGRAGSAAEQALSEARRARAVMEQAEVQLLEAALAWTQAHVVDDAQLAAYVVDPLTDSGSEGLLLGGEGAPMIGFWCLAPFAASQGLSTGAGQDLLADVLALAYRLPRLWARVQAGEVRVWRARRVAQASVGLSLEAAMFVDRHVAPYAHAASGAQVERSVQEALGRFMPQHAARQAAAGAELRYFSIDTQQVSFDGTMSVTGELDIADALQLEKAVSAGAAHLKALGSTGCLDVRRAMAVGELARDQLAFGFATRPDPEAQRVGTAVEPSIEASAGARLADPQRGLAVEAAAGVFAKPEPPSRVPITRQVVLYVHLAAEAILNQTEGVGFARLENGGGQLVTPQQVAVWCGAETSRISVRPVIDLTTELAADSYEVPDRLREYVIARDRRCVFPWCNRNARGCDIDHIVPWSQAGPTHTANLAPLCRRHHVAKTHHGWRYRRVGPAAYVWTDPHGQTFHVNRAGTTDHTPEVELTHQGRHEHWAIGAARRSAPTHAGEADPPPQPVGPSEPSSGHLTKRRPC